VFGILTGPVAAVPGKALFEAVAGPPRDPERRLVAGLDLQPDPGDAEAPVGPRRGGPDGLRGDAPAPLPGSYPVGQFGASRPVRHQPDRAEKLPAAQEAEDKWVGHHNEVAEATLLLGTDSWWVGANIPGKPRTLYPYVGGVGPFRAICQDVAEKGYEGLVLTRH
jgi:hypothetical protein